MDIKVGDILTRMLGGKVAMSVVVGEVTENHIKVGSADGIIPWEIGWTFNSKTLAEIDEDLGWDGLTKTGSYLTIQ